jgi:hypothetical protein
MRRMRGILGWLLAVVLAIAGCQTSRPGFRRPPLVEEYVLPPADDSRFSNPVTYPKETMPPPGSRFGSGVGPSLGSGY